MDRITEKHLKSVVDRINRVTNSPLESYTRDGDKLTANIGNYHIDFAYGGVSLDRMVSPGGGVSDVFRCGHVTKRELYNRMHAFLEGLEMKQSIAA